MAPRELTFDDFPDCQFLDIGGRSIAYVDTDPDTSSQRETILCVHGNPTWGYYYRRVVERFRDSHRVIAVDHLGCGRSDRPTRRQFGYRMTDHRDNLVRLIDQLNLSRLTLVAHDWGGAIGTAAAVQRKDVFDRVILLNTAAFPPPYVPRRIAVLRTPLLGTLAMRGGNVFARAATRMTTHRGRLDPSTASALLAPYDSWENRVAIDAFVRDIPLGAQHPTHQSLTRLEQSLPSLADKPLGLIWGMKDWCFRPECLDRFRQTWPDADVTRIDDAGHYVLEDAPEEVLAAIDRTLRQPPANQ